MAHCTLKQLVTRAEQGADGLPLPSDARATHLSDISRDHRFTCPCVWSVYCAVVSAEYDSKLLVAFGRHTLDELLSAFTAADKKQPSGAQAVFREAIQSLGRANELDDGELSRQFYSELSTAREAQFVRQPDTRLGRAEDRTRIAQMSATELQYMEQHTHDFDERAHDGCVYLLNGDDYVDADK